MTLTTEGKPSVATLSDAEKTEVVAEEATTESPAVVEGSEAGNRAWAATSTPVARID